MYSWWETRASLSLRHGVESLPLECRDLLLELVRFCRRLSVPSHFLSFCQYTVCGDGEGGGRGAGRSFLHSCISHPTPSSLFLFTGSYSLDALCYKNNDMDAMALSLFLIFPIASFVFPVLLFLPLHFCLWQVSLCNSGWPATCCADWAVLEFINSPSLQHLCARRAPCSFSSFTLAYGGDSSSEIG